MLSSFLAMPRAGHLVAVFHIFAYLEKKHNAQMIFDPTYPDIDMRNFKMDHDWKVHYGDVTEAIPPNALAPRGRDVDLRLFVDSDHAGDLACGRSRTGFYIFLNSAPILWFSKRQPTVETSVFGAEFVALKAGIKAMRGIRYKLRMMGIPIDGSALVYGDNMSVIHNTQNPQSALKKKSLSICYHACREAVAMGEILTGHIRSEENPANLATKVIPGGMKQDYLIDMVLHDIILPRS